MARSCQEIFETAIALMDELDEEGNADTQDTAEYKNRTVMILNILSQELYPYSDTYDTPTDSSRSTTHFMRTMEDYPDLDDYICGAILPYGLAAHLLMEEDPTAANFFQQRYEDLKQKLREGRLAASEDIEDVYSSGTGIGFEWTTRW